MPKFEIVFTNEPTQFEENAKRKMEHIATLVNLQELSLPEPVFPKGAEFAAYEEIPLACVPTFEGGSLYLAFDALIPRPFPSGSFYKNGDFLNENEFRELRRKYLSTNSKNIDR